MESPTIKRNRNGLFLHLFGIAIFLLVLIYLLAGHVLPVYALAFSMPAYALLAFLQMRDTPVLIMQAAILGMMNISVFILNIETLAPVNIVFFVFPLIVSAMYYDTMPAIALGIITTVEIAMLAFLFGGFSERPPMSYVNAQLFIFMFFALNLSIVHSIFFRRVMLEAEEKNNSMERALSSKEGYLHLFFQTAKDAIAVFDSDNKIIAINPAFEELYGWSLPESIGKSLPLVPPEHLDEAAIRTREVQAGKSYSLLETEDLKKDGSRFDAQITLSPIIGPSGNVLATSVISRDISYRKEAEKLILQSEKLKLTGEIAAGVAHEIRNPMTVISGFVQMMENDAVHPQKEYIGLIRSEIARIDLIISEFLMLAKPQATERKEIGFKKMVDDIALLFGPQLNLDNILFTSHFERDDFVVVGEEHHLKQVVINLMKNAVEALEGIGRQGRIHMAIESSSGRSVSLFIKDNGNGIPDESAPLIFEPFYTTKATGTGLGLLISQKIIQEHRGTLTIESEEGRGTAATVTLPLK